MSDSLAWTTKPYLPNADDKPADDEYAQYIADIDPADWVDPHWVEHRGSGAGEDRGIGQGDQSGGGGGEHRGSADALATGWAEDEDEAVCSHTSRLHQLQHIQGIANREIRGAAGKQLSMVVARVAKVEGKRFHRLLIIIIIIIIVTSSPVAFCLKVGLIQLYKDRHRSHLCRQRFEGQRHPFGQSP